jgi:hypothetical protein
MSHRPIRILTQAAFLAACAGAAMLPATSARAVDKWWNTTNGNWNTGANWFAAGVPTNVDNVFIGNTAIAENASVELNVNATVASLTVTDGMRLRTNASRLTVSGAMLISGVNYPPDNFRYSSTVHVFQGAAPIDFQTGSLSIADGGTLRLEDGAAVQSGGQVNLEASASIYGEGVINLNANGIPAMIVNGSIQASPGAIGLTFNQLGTGLIDLDGSVADGPNGGINVTGSMNNLSEFSRLTINGTGLTDPFDDFLWIGPGNTVNMNLSNGWTLGAGGELRMVPFQGHIPVLNGGRMTLQGRMEVSLSDGDAVVNAPITFAPAGDVVIATNSRLTCYGPVTVHGGTYNLASDSMLVLNGATEWNGTVTCEGLGQIFVQTSSTVTGPTVVNAHTFDFDGSGVTTWNIQAPMTINATIVDPLTQSDINKIDGTINISGPSDARLTINIAADGEPWSIGGTLNLAAPLGNATTRLAGEIYSISGALNINGAVRCEGTFGLYPGSVTTFANANSRLEGSSAWMIFEDAHFVGGGTVSCAASGAVRIKDTVDLGTTRLSNQGDLEINFGVGQIRVGGFTQTATGTYHVDIGGYEPATRHDHLIVTIQPASLGGMVDVDLVDAGDGAFTPQIGDTFTILTSRNGFVGQFAGVAPTLRNGVLYSWSLLQDAMSVRVQLDSIEARCNADWNCDGFLDFFDYDDYVETFEGGTPPDCRSDADFNGDGFVDFFDYDDFVAFFESGC